MFISASTPRPPRQPPESPEQEREQQQSHRGSTRRDARDRSRAQSTIYTFLRGSRPICWASSRAWSPGRLSRISLRPLRIQELFSHLLIIRKLGGHQLCPWTPVRCTRIPSTAAHKGRATEFASVPIRSPLRAIAGLRREVFISFRVEGRPSHVFGGTNAGVVCAGIADATADEFDFGP